MIHGTDAYQRHCAGLTLLSCSAALALTRGFVGAWSATRKGLWGVVAGLSTGDALLTRG